MVLELLVRGVASVSGMLAGAAWFLTPYDSLTLALALVFIVSMAVGVYMERDNADR